MRKNYTKSIILVLAVLCLFALAAWIFLPREKDAVKVANSDAASKISSEDMDTFRKVLIYFLRDNGLIASDATVDDVAVRADSVKASSTTDANKNVTTKTTFLIDIDSIKQTYHVKIYNSTAELTSPPVEITCPNTSEMKYPDVECVGRNGDTNKKVSKNLPYTASLDSGEKVLVKNLTDSTTLQIYLYSCNAKNPPVSAAEKLVRDWVSSIGDNAKNYTYNVRTGYCEGDAI